MLFRLFSCACVVVGLSVGGSSTHRIAASPTRWVLTALDGKPLPALPGEARPLLVLPAGSAARQNQYEGPFQPSVTERLVLLPRVITAMMRSSDEAIETELRYLSVLEKTTRFEITHNTLLLYAAEHNAPIATFKAGQSW